jgi:hypothetical protein
VAALQRAAAHCSDTRTAWQQQQTPLLLLAVVRRLPCWTSNPLVLSELMLMGGSLHSQQQQQQKVKSRVVCQIADLLAFKCSKCTLDLSPG